MRVANETTFGGQDRQAMLDIAISLEGFSDHPIARAFKQKKALLRHQVVDVEQTNGAGLKGKIQNKVYYLGSESFITESLGLTPAIKDLNVTQVYLASDDGVLAVYEIHDDIRNGAKSMLAWLQEQGKKVSLLSGDRQAPVKWLAKKLAIKDVQYEASPLDKLNEIERLQVNGQQVVMVGDGVNDAPILAKADVSISVSGASQLARASSDILLMNNDMQGLQNVFQLSKKMRAAIKQNMGWALLYNVGALPLAMAGHVEPWQAALGMSVSSLVVVLNSFRLRFALPTVNKAGASTAVYNG